jgi:hypothetical protein
VLKWRAILAIGLIGLTNVIKALQCKLRAIAKVLLSLDTAGRNVTVFPDDIFVVSYPKSGNTWTRFLIANLMYENQFIGFHNIEEKLPDIYRCADSDLLRLKSPRILKSHEYFDPRYKKVIYIVRDPRDVLISYYHHQIKFGKLPEGHPLEEYSARFQAGEVDRFGTWGENVGSWMGARDAGDNFLVLRYEDLLNNSQKELRNIASFLKFERSDEAIRLAVSMSSADNMRLLEQQQAMTWKVTKKSRRDKTFVRVAKAGGWRDNLPEGIALSIRQRWGGWMDRFDYK